MSVRYRGRDFYKSGSLSSIDLYKYERLITLRFQLIKLQLVKHTDNIAYRNRSIESSQAVIKYINNVKSMSNSTAQEYKNRLDDFAKFVHKTYECNIDRLIHKIFSYDIFYRSY